MKRPRRATRKTPPRPEAPADASEDTLLLERLRTHLGVLGLPDVEEPLSAHLAWATTAKPSPLVLLERILGEAAGRVRERRIERRIKQCGLRMRKTLEAFEWGFQPKLDRALVEDLATLRFVDNGEDVILTGKPGTGKSHILSALALRACHKQLHVRYVRCVDMIDTLHAALADRTFDHKLAAWSRPELLLIDDVGLGQVKKHDDEPTAAHILFNLLDRRHEERLSTAITSNISLSAWGSYLGDATLTAAILDRLTMNAIRLNIDGPSYRQHVGRQRASKYAAAQEQMITD